MSVEIEQGLESSSDCFLSSHVEPEAQRGAVGYQGHSQDEGHTQVLSYLVLYSHRVATYPFLQVSS